MPDDIYTVEVDKSGTVIETTPEMIQFECPRGHRFLALEAPRVQIALNGEAIYQSDPFCPVCQAQWTAAMFPLHEVKTA